MRIDVLLLALFFFLSVAAVPADAACAGGGYATGKSCTLAGVDYAGCCEGPASLQWCQDGQVCVKNCANNPPSGAGNFFYCGWDAGKSFYNCALSPTSDPSSTNPRDCACTPKCDGKNCGPDGCDGVCGICGTGSTCDAWGICQVQACVKTCGSKICGPDGCGGVCGTCAPTMACDNFGQCSAPTCVPSCNGLQCGPNGCGGSCGACDTWEMCSGAGQCVLKDPSCTPSCGTLECGNDGCGGSCGSCAGGETCSISGQCEQGCTPACLDTECGSDGCGGTCGSCGLNESCIQGVCESGACTPACEARACGNDGCGGLCGTCQTGATCNSAGTCVADGRVPIASCPAGQQATYEGCEPIKTTDRAATGCHAGRGDLGGAWMGVALLSLWSLGRVRRRIPG